MFLNDINVKLVKLFRFWYETSDAAVRFTESQLTEIRKATLAKIVCENADVVNKIQKSAFDQYHEFLNERVPCRSLPQINLQLWKDEAHKCKVRSLGKRERSFGRYDILGLSYLFRYFYFYEPEDQ